MHKQLDGGLILRSLSEGHASDRDNLAAFNARIHGQDEDDAKLIEAWTRDFIFTKHPEVTQDDIWVIVDPAKDNAIVSSLLLIPQTWRYEDVEFGVGRVELVATDEEYRRRGLIRSQMDVAHARSTELGHLVQGITGIRHYYRRFGYSMSIDLGPRATIPAATIPKTKEDEQPKYTLRPATDDDLPQLSAWDAYRARTSLVSCVRTPEVWRYELHERAPLAGFSLFTYIIVNKDGAAVGYVAWRMPVPGFLGIMSYVVGDKSSYLDTFNDVLRGIKAVVEAHYVEPDKRPKDYHFDSGMDESLDILVKKMFPGLVQPPNLLYAWYIRVADLPRFIRHIAPVLERRLAGSGANCFTGDFNITFFTFQGLRITFEQGKITDAQMVEMADDSADAGFPYLTFLDTLFGRRTQEEIRNVLPESFANGKGLVLLEALFPRQRSWLNALA